MRRAADPVDVTSEGLHSRLGGSGEHDRESVQYAAAADPYDLMAKVVETERRGEVGDRSSQARKFALWRALGDSLHRCCLG
jgi:hypothetical protein